MLAWQERAADRQHRRVSEPLAAGRAAESKGFRGLAFIGAVEKTRTSTGCPTATSTLRVYQFRHDRIGTCQAPPGIPNRPVAIKRKRPRAWTAHGHFEPWKRPWIGASTISPVRLRDGARGHGGPRGRHPRRHGPRTGLAAGASAALHRGHQRQSRRPAGPGPLSRLSQRPRRAIHLSRAGPARGLCHARPQAPRAGRAAYVQTSRNG